MKKLFSLLLTTTICSPLYAQSINWDMSSINSSLRTFVPNALGLICFVALLGWTAFNLFKNWDNRQEIMTNFVWTLLAILIAYGIVYMAMNVLL